MSDLCWQYQIQEYKVNCVPLSQTLSTSSDLFYQEVNTNLTSKSLNLSDDLTNLGLRPYHKRTPKVSFNWSFHFRYDHHDPGYDSSTGASYQCSEAAYLARTGPTNSTVSGDVLLRLLLDR